MKVLKSFEFKAFGARDRYDWDKLLDGGIYQLEEGVDYKCQAQTMILMARTRAKKRGMNLKAAKVEGGCVIQAVSAPTVEEATEQPVEQVQAKPRKKGKRETDEATADAMAG